MENKPIVKRERGKFEKGTAKVPGSGIKKGQKRVVRFKKALFNHAIDIVEDPERVSQLSDETIVKLAAAWGMKMEVTSGSGDNIDNSIILIHNVPSKVAIENNLIDVTKDAVREVENKEFDPKKIGRYNPNLPDDVDLREELPKE